MLVDGKEVNWSAGKTDRSSDRSSNACKAELLFSSGARSGLDRVTFDNQLEVLIKKKKDGR